MDDPQLTVMGVIRPDRTPPLDFPPALLLRPRVMFSGMTDVDIHRQVATSTWTRVRRGAFVEAGAPISRVHRHRLLIRATMPKIAPDSVLSHVSAAVWHGVDPWDVDLRRVHVSRPTSHGRTSRHLVVHETADAPHVRLLEGIPVTDPARTLIDVALTEEFEQALVIAETMLRTGLTNRMELDRLAPEINRRHGGHRARRLIEMADVYSESVGESRSRYAILRHGLPVPEQQAVIRNHAGTAIARVDFLWPEHRVIGEFDGAVKYGRLLAPGSSAGDVVFAEKIREEALVTTDHEVLRWTWGDFDHFEVIGDRFRRKADLAARFAS